MNRIVRRFFPKGTSFDEVTAAQVAQAEDWMNNYPRAIFPHPPLQAVQHPDHALHGVIRHLENEAVAGEALCQYRVPGLRWNGAVPPPPDAPDPDILLPPLQRIRAREQREHEPDRPTLLPKGQLARCSSNSAPADRHPSMALG